MCLTASMSEASLCEVVIFNMVPYHFDTSSIVDVAYDVVARCHMLVVCSCPTDKQLLDPSGISYIEAGRRTRYYSSGFKQG